MIDPPPLDGLLIDSVLRPLLGLLEATCAPFVEGSLGSLVFLACVLRYAGRRIAGTDGPAPASPWPRRLGIVAFLAVGLTGYLTTPVARNRDAFEPYLSLTVRAALAMAIVEGALATLFPLLTRVGAMLAAPPRSFQTSLRRARRDYEAECRALRSAQLDPEELEAALLFARQRYLSRIRGDIDREA